MQLCEGSGSEWILGPSLRNFNVNDSDPFISISSSNSWSVFGFGTIRYLMAAKLQERRVIGLFVESLRLIRSVEFTILKEGDNDFPDFILHDQTTGKEMWVEVVQAVESESLRASETRARRIYEATAREYRSRGEEVVIEFSPRGIEHVTPSPGYGVTGVFVSPPRRISPEEWVAKALEHKGRADRYGASERTRTTLLIDCSEEVLVGKEDALQIRDDLQGNTVGFREIWCASANWQTPNGVLLAP